MSCSAKRKWTILALMFSPIILAHLGEAHRTLHQAGTIMTYPINGRLVQYLPQFEDSRSEHHCNQEKDYPPCPFNTMCFCSNTGPDLGLVFCCGVELGHIPAHLNNTKFHTLTLRNNRLRYVDEYALDGTGMYRLEIRHNLIFDLPEKALSGVQRSLWQLDLRHNQLSNVPSKALRKLRKLSYLDLTGNRISDLTKDDFMGLETSLKTLILAENSITNLPSGVFQKLQVVQTIDLRGNNIHFVSDMVFQGVSSNLIQVNFADNLLKRIPFEALSELHNLQILNLGGNRISKTFDALFTSYLSVDTLILDRNEIESLLPVSFQNFANINRTSLRGNPLTEISNDAFKDTKISELYIHDCNLISVSETAFRGLESSLKVLDLSYNSLATLPEKVFEKLESVYSLSLSYNKLSIDPNKSFNRFKHKIRYLNLLGENMGTFPVEFLKEIRNIRTLGLSTMPDSTLSNSDFVGFGPAVEKLYLLNSGITEISANAFEHVPGLKVLDLSFNSINFLDKDAFLQIGGGLKELRISSGLSLNRVPPEPMIHLTYLRELDFSNNKLIEVDGGCFRYMRNLQKLILQDNKIRQLVKNHFQGQFHPFLEYIKLSYNSISIIESQTFRDYKNLHSIYLNDNMITKLDRFAFLNLENLRSLYLQGNNIYNISFEAFQNLPKLQYLDLSFNEMRNLNLDAFEQVGTLSSLTIDVSFNKISALKINGSMWNSYSAIKILVFSNNNISSISPNYFESVRSSLVHMRFENNIMKNISSGIFNNMLQLTHLNFANNLIESLDPNAFEGSNRIQYINFRQNRLADFPDNIFKEQENLHHLDISFNKFKNISGGLFSDTPLEILRASNNKIGKFPDLALQKCSGTLRIIDLGNNEITDLKSTVLNRLQNLVFLDLSSNHIKTIESRAFTTLENLIHLDISHNPFQKIGKNSLEGLQDHLRSLNLANVSLSTIPDMSFEHLAEFNVSLNKISFLPSVSFSNLSTLRVFDLSYNDLQTASNSVWQTLPRLQQLLLKGNPITRIDNDSFVGLQRLEKLDIRQLPLQIFESGTLNFLENIKELSITISNFNIGRSLATTPSLQKLELEVKGQLNSQLQGSPLPYKLSNITLTGRRFNQISVTALQMLQAKELKLSIHHTSLHSISKEFFTNLGKVRFIALASLNNSFGTMGNPSNAVHPGEPKSVFLTDFRLEGNNWNCDCGIGWIEPWMKTWRRMYCCENRENDCEGSLRSLRKSTCGATKDKSIMEALKNDLECEATSAAPPLHNYDVVAPLANLPVCVVSIMTSLVRNIA